MAARGRRRVDYYLPISSAASLILRQTGYCDAKPPLHWKVRLIPIRKAVYSTGSCQPQDLMRIRTAIVEWLLDWISRLNRASKCRMSPTRCLTNTPLLLVQDGCPRPFFTKDTVKPAEGKASIIFGLDGFAEGLGLGIVPSCVCRRIAIEKGKTVGLNNAAAILYRVQLPEAVSN